MDMPALVHQLIADEGTSLVPYRDGPGHLTIGHGHLLLATDRLGPGSRITLSYAQTLLLADIGKAERACEHIWPGFRGYPERAQRVLVQVAFMTGETRLRHFPRLRAAVSRADWRAAACALKDSKLARQVKRRAARLVDELRTAGDPDAY